MSLLDSHRRRHPDPGRAEPSGAGETRPRAPSRALSA